MALTPDHIPGPALDMGGLSPEAEQDIELGAALYWGRVAADGALQPPPTPHTLQGPITGGAGARSLVGAEQVKARDLGGAGSLQLQ